MKIFIGHTEWLSLTCFTKKILRLKDEKVEVFANREKFSPNVLEIVYSVKDFGNGRFAIMIAVEVRFEFSMKTIDREM